MGLSGATTILWAVLAIGARTIGAEDITIEGGCTLRCTRHGDLLVCDAIYEFNVESVCGTENATNATIPSIVAPHPTTNGDEVIVEGVCTLHCVSHDGLVTCTASYSYDIEPICDIDVSPTPAVTQAPPTPPTSTQPPTTTTKATTEPPSSEPPIIATEIITEIVPEETPASSTTAGIPPITTPLPDVTDLHPPSPESEEPEETRTTEEPLTNATGVPSTVTGPTPDTTETTADNFTSEIPTGNATQPTTGGGGSTEVTETPTPITNGTTPGTNGTTVVPPGTNGTTTAPPGTNGTTTEQSNTTETTGTTTPQTTTPESVSIDLPAVPRDCYDVYHGESDCDGVYTIYPEGWPSHPFEVSCKMSHGGGWTVIQRRQDGSRDFYREWTQYKHGFGDLHEEHWLGNEQIHYLTNQRDYEMRIDILTRGGHSYHLRYNMVRVGDEDSNYQLEILGNFTGNTGYDYMAYHRGARFSTFDDSHNHCSETFRGGWWYDSCYDANLNGNYNTTTYSGLCLFDRSATKSYECGLLYTEMKVRPV